MTRRLAIHTGTVALALSLTAAFGCTKTRPCKQGTALLDLRFAAPAQDGDRVDLTIDVTDTPHQTITGTLLLHQGTRGGTAEVDFPTPYRAGAHVSVLARAMRGDDMVEEIMTSATLADGCSRIVLQNQTVGSPDGAADAAGGSAGGGEGGSGGTVSDGGTVDRPYVEVGSGGCTGSCTPGETAACGKCGTKTCGADCSWGACSAEGVCLAGSTQSCGNCGTQFCDTTCHWATCTGEGTCKAGDSMVCGNCGRMTCSATCTWGACAGDGACTPGMTRACGRCGTEMCTSGSTSCGWSGTCTGEGACSPGSTRPCGTGNCGTEACGPNCQWSGVCQNPGECVPGAGKACGNCGTVTCGTDCHWPTSASACTGQGCAPGTVAGCGNCGSTTCGSNCQYGACTGQGVCARGDTTDCGACLDGIQTCSSSCTWGTCVGASAPACCSAFTAASQAFTSQDPELIPLPVCP